MNARLLLFLVFAPTMAMAGGTTTTFDAAVRWEPNIVWDKSSVLHGNFMCRGKTEFAVLGATRPEDVELNGVKLGYQTDRDAVVAIFVNGFENRPEILKFSAISIEEMKLRTESQYFGRRKFDATIGKAPEGLQSSKKCLGLNLGDGKQDSRHIYWNHIRKEFSAWAL